jgi:hypothetical protein
MTDRAKITEFLKAALAAGICAPNGPGQRGTAGWIRTTDLLIHSQCQVIDFPRVRAKCLYEAE